MDRRDCRVRQLTDIQNPNNDMTSSFIELDLLYTVVGQVENGNG